MRLKIGSNVRVVLTDGTAFEGKVARSWRWRTVKLVDAMTQTRDGEIRADGYLLVPAGSILFAQVGA